MRITIEVSGYKEAMGISLHQRGHHLSPSAETSGFTTAETTRNISIHQKAKDSLRNKQHAYLYLYIYNQNLVIFLHV